jgi:hypothetical protein
MDPTQQAPPPDDAQDPAAPDQGPPDTGGDQGAPNGNDPAQAIGYIDPSVSPKVKTFLLAAKQILISPQGADAIKGLLSQSKGDPATAIAMLVGKTIDKLQEKLGPLNDQEHDQVAVHLCGWIVSTLQHLGCPGLDTQQGRHDLLGRILQALDQATQGDPSQGDPNAPPDQGAPQGPPQAAQGPPAGPMGQFAGGA